MLGAYFCDSVPVKSNLSFPSHIQLAAEHGAAGAEWWGKVSRGSRGLLVVGCGLIIGLIATRKVMHKMEEREKRAVKSS